MFISLGVDCGTAIILRKLNLRQCSLPFDWVITYEGITNIINHDFQDYIPKEHNYSSVYNVAFLHNTFPQDTDKMVERLHRFKKILESNEEKITFVRKSHGEQHHTECSSVVNDIEDAIKLDSLLKQKYPSLHYEIHIILICHPCFSDTVISDVPCTIHVHNISRPYPENVNVTNPDYFDELCTKLFTK